MECKASEDKENLLKLSKSRLERANNAVKVAKRDFDCGDFNESTSRSYYALFYILLAVTELDGFRSSKHSGVISYFTREYLKTEIFDRKISDSIKSAFKLRNNADYEGMYVVSQDDAQKQINDAEEAIHTIQPYLQSRWTEMEDELMNAIFTRTSTRQFEDKPVENKYIIKLLRAAMAAPTACNQQEWEFCITDDKEIISRLSMVSPYAGPVANAPYVIVPCWHTDGLPAPMMAEIDMAMATQNILLEAEELGLGAVMIGIAPIPERMDAVAEILGLPENFKAFTIIPVGWPLNKRPQEDRYEPARIHTL